MGKWNMHCRVPVSELCVVVVVGGLSVGPHVKTITLQRYLHSIDTWALLEIITHQRICSYIN